MAEVSVKRNSTGDLECEVRHLFVFPSEVDTQIHDNVHDQLQHFTHFLATKMNEFKEFIEQNSVVVFTVNYIQNRFIAAEFCTEFAKLFKILNVRTVAEFSKAIETLQNEPNTAEELERFKTTVKDWDDFIAGIERTLEAKVGPSTTKSEDDSGVLFELGIESKTISHYVKGSAFDMVLVVVVRSFTSTTVAQHIMGLYNRIPEFRKLGCDVCVLTKGPPVGTRGGSYIKLIGVPFRRLYDENEALDELKFHRRSTIDLVGWEALLRTVDASLAEEPRPHSSSKITSNSPHEDQDYFITQKGGTILVDRSGNVLFKYIESEDVPWPTVDDVLDQVRKANESSPPKVSGAVKVDSEISAKEKKHDKQQTSCCVVM